MMKSEMPDKKLSLLLIGHLTDYPSGSSISFRQLVDILGGRENVNVKVINTYRPSHLTKSRLVNLIIGLKVILLVLLNLRKAQVVSFHASLPGMMKFSAVLFLITRFYKKPLVLRLFGGALEEEYKALSSLKRWLFNKTVLHADLILLQTRHLIEFFNNNTTQCNIKWYSNSRRMPDIPLKKKIGLSSCKRFVFMGIIKEEKGIEVILNTVPFLIHGITVDLFGPLEGKYTKEYINSKGQGVISYKGILRHDEVYDKLSYYDALILPTFYEGEGYPGVILEAYSVGLPVIATQWRAIPEIVDKDTGILVPPRSADSLSKAMNILYEDTALYVKLKRGVLAKRVEFSDSYWVDRFVQLCEELVD